jgi:hypothetical protein
MRSISAEHPGQVTTLIVRPHLAMNLKKCLGFTLRQAAQRLAAKLRLSSSLPWARYLREP